MSWVEGRWEGWEEGSGHQRDSALVLLAGSCMMGEKEGTEFAFLSIHSSCLSTHDGMSAFCFLCAYNSQ